MEGTQEVHCVRSIGNRCRPARSPTASKLRPATAGSVNPGNSRVADSQELGSSKRVVASAKRRTSLSRWITTVSLREQAQHNANGQVQAVAFLSLNRRETQLLGLGNEPGSSGGVALRGAREFAGQPESLDKLPTRSALVKLEILTLESPWFCDSVRDGVKGSKKQPRKIVVVNGGANSLFSAAMHRLVRGRTVFARQNA